MAAKNKNTSVKKFDFTQFKKYVETYDPKKHAFEGSPEIIFEDMLYGIGISIDKKHKFYEGFKLFKKFLTERISKESI